MGHNKNIRNRIEGLQHTIAAHEQKIQEEEAKPHCNMKRVNHWRGEIYE